MQQERYADEPDYPPIGSDKSWQFQGLWGRIKGHFTYMNVFHLSFFRPIGFLTSPFESRSPSCSRFFPFSLFFPPSFFPSLSFSRDRERSKQNAYQAQRLVMPVENFVCFFLPPLKDSSSPACFWQVSRMLLAKEMFRPLVKQYLHVMRGAFAAT